MFNKIYDWFDNSFDYGFLKEGTKRSRVDTDCAPMILTQAADVWDLWIKQPIRFVLSGSPTNREHGTALYTFENALNVARELYVADDDAKAEAMKNPDTPLYRNHCDSDSPENVTISWESVMSCKDFASAVDAVTATGLEALEFNNTTLKRLTYRCVQDLVDNGHGFKGQALTSLVAEEYDMALMAMENLKIPYLPYGPGSQPKPEYRDYSLYLQHCEMFRKVWVALCTRQHRDTILSKWPGWAELFSASDELHLDSQASVQKVVTGKQYDHSEYERFFIALAFNTNSMDKRVKLPKEPSFDAAANVVRRAWPQLMTATPDDQIKMLAQMMTEVRNLLSMEKNKNNSTRKGKLTTVNDMLQESNPRVNLHASVACTPSDQHETEHGTPTNPPTEAAYFQMSDLVRKGFTPRQCDSVHRKSCGPVLVNQDLVDAVAGSVWRVACPPPTEHGQTSGMLDEGALHKLAGWGDPHVFDQPPEAGAGSVVIAVLLDVSGSMDGKMVDTKTFLHALMEGSKRHPNVKIIPIAYSQVVDFTQEEGNHAGICAMIEMSQTSDIEHLVSSGGTPTGLALKTAIERLDMESQDASKGILVITDGQPCGQVLSPGVTVKEFQARHDAMLRSAKNGETPQCAIWWHDTPEVVHEICRSSPYPVVGVGLGEGIKQNTMVESFGSYRSFRADSPAAVIPIVCEILESATI